MNKVICDVCGTAYPETANQCPICGSAKVASQAAAAEAENQESTAYTYVRGGRFSKKNVKARNRGNRYQESRSRQSSGDEEKANKGLVAIVILLLVAIIGVVIYIGIQFFDFDLGNTDNPGSSTVSTQPSTQPTESTGAGQLSVPCTKLELVNVILEFLDVTDKWTLEVKTLEPLDCTEEITFVSSNPEVVTVTKTADKAALVQPVGNGEATITVTCGTVTAECKVTCKLAGFVDPTEPTQPPVADFDFKFNTKYMDGDKFDTTFTKKGYVWTAYTSELTIDPSEITWISDNPEVCTVENGKVTMVGPGTTEIHAQYGGKTVTCIVRCQFKEEDNSGEGDSTDSTEPDAPKKYKISSEDMTIKVDGYWWLKLQDDDKNTIEGVTWEVDHEGYVKIEGNKLTGVKSTSDLPMKYVVVSTTYEGETYSCIVRISAS